MQQIPNEVQSLIFYQLDHAALGAAFQVCKAWNSHMQEGFFAGYAGTRSPQQIDALPPKLFKKLLPDFSQEQLFDFEGKKITRHIVHEIPETPQNRVNLRLVKLLCSLEWYREIIQDNIQKCIDKWYYRRPNHTSQFMESQSYIHLFMLGNSDYLRDNGGKTVSSADYELDKNFTLIKKNEWIINFNSNSPFDAIDKLCAYDDVGLKCIDSQARDRLYQAVFSRYRFTHFISPQSRAGWFYLPTHLFINLFDTLTAKCQVTSSHAALDLQVQSTEGMPNLKVYPGMTPTNQAFIADADVEDTVANGLWLEGFNEFKLMSLNTKKLDSLGKWLFTACIPIGELVIHSEFNSDITCEALKSFEVCLHKSKVVKVNVMIFSNDDSVRSLAKEIETRYNSKNKGV